MCGKCRQIDRSVSMAIAGVCAHEKWRHDYSCDAFRPHESFELNPVRLISNLYGFATSNQIPLSKMLIIDNLYQNLKGILGSKPLQLKENSFAVEAMCIWSSSLVPIGGYRDASMLLQTQNAIERQCSKT